MWYMRVKILNVQWQCLVRLKPVLEHFLEPLEFPFVSCFPIIKKLPGILEEVDARFVGESFELFFQHPKIISCL